MSAEAVRTRAVRHSHAAAWPAPVERPPELAELVWRRALALAAPGEFHDSFEMALILLRAGGHHPGAMTEALALSRTYLLLHPDDERACAGEKILQAAIGFLGIRP
jgi:hypothetical protein